MSTATTPAAAPVRTITLDAGHVELSALLSEPSTAPPRATVVALHGAGMTAGYFDASSDPRLSLLRLGADAGFRMVAVDRPGYGLSAANLPAGQSLTDQVDTLHRALMGLRAERGTGAGVFLLAHSFGGKLALRMAADDRGAGLLGVDISGCGHRYAASSAAVEDPARSWSRSWGPLRSYPPSTFRSSGALVSPIPELEQLEIPHWPREFPGIAACVRVPVRFTFAEYESWWRHDHQTIAEMRGHLAAPQVLVDRQAGAGHNISLGWAGRSYHLRALGFFEECLTWRDAV